MECQCFCGGKQMWGADVKDCFWNWLIHPCRRRWFGINLPDSLIKACLPVLSAGVQVVSGS